MRSAVRTLAVVSFLLLLVAGLQAQTASGVLHGQVSDPSGAVVTQATVTVTDSNGQKTTVATNGRGVYEVKGLAPGKYSVRITAKGFAPYDLADVSVASGATPSLDISLEVATEQQTVTVQDENTTVSTDSASNSSTVVIKGKDLEALSDDPDELQSDLEALAGPSAGPNGGQIYIDGFSNGTLPPKSSIREIRINQNPFSAQYDRLGFGRVEVFTKPGKDTYHGQFQVNVNNSVFNALSPYLDLNGMDAPSYGLEQYNGNFGGPLSKNASFFFSVQRRNLDEPSIVSATIPCQSYTSTTPCSPGNFSPWRYSAAILSPRTHTEISPRIDYQLTKNNTLTARYEHEGSTTENGGIGQFSLPWQQGYNSDGTEQNLQISDTQVINTSMINETRFQYVRDVNNSMAAYSTPTISVRDAFTDGGSGGGQSFDIQNHYELQNYTSKMHGNHFMRFGGRVRLNTDHNVSQSNYNGTFTYTSLDNYEQALLGTATPSQFRITQGNSLATVSQTDLGLYAEDDWRIRPKFTLSYGLRYETQNNINNKNNFAPRMGFAWGLGKGPAPKTVLRAGFGMFYDRFSQGNVLQVNRTNGADAQKQYLVINPGFTTIPANLDAYLTSAQISPVVYEIDPNLHAPYTMQAAATIERQITKASKVTVSYIGSRGLHQLVSEVLQPTLPTDPTVYQYQSAGTFKQNQLMVNANSSIGKSTSLFGYYSLSYANGNTNGASSFPSVPGDLAADWGRAPFDVRHRGMIGGTVGFLYGIRFNPFLIISSSRPFNITTGNANSVNIYNQRPSFGDCSQTPLPSNVISTPFGCFNTTPGSASIPVNYGNGPGFFSFNMRVSKTFGFGHKSEGSQMAAGGGGHGHGPGGMPGSGHDIGRMMGGGVSSGQRYNLTFSASARNLFNNVNATSPVGNLSSTLFGQSNSLASFGPFSSSANRMLSFQAQFSF
jgi:hypothetical protein